MKNQKNISNCPTNTPQHRQEPQPFEDATQPQQKDLFVSRPIADSKISIGPEKAGEIQNSLAESELEERNPEYLEEIREREESDEPEEDGVRPEPKRGKELNRRSKF